MEADQGRRLARIEVADDGVANLPVEILQSVGLGVNGGSGGTGPKGAILRFLDQEKDFLHGALQWSQSDSGGRDACCPYLGKGTGAACQTLSRVNCSRPAPTPEGVPVGAIAWRAAQNKTWPPRRTLPAGSWGKT